MQLLSDVVQRFLDRCDEAGIRNPTEFLISKMPHIFVELKGIFPRGILPTDIDGEVELNGYFLRFEIKNESRVKNGEIPRGQLLLFNRLTRTCFHTILLIGIDREGNPTCVEVFGRATSPKFFNCNGWETIRELCSRWVVEIEKRKDPSQSSKPIEALLGLSPK